MSNNIKAASNSPLLVESIQTLLIVAVFAFLVGKAAYELLLPVASFLGQLNTTQKMVKTTQKMELAFYRRLSKFPAPNWLAKVIKVMLTALELSVKY